MVDRRHWAVLALVGCSSPAPAVIGPPPAQPAPVKPAVDERPIQCDPVAGFAADTPIPEASAAAWFPIGGKPMLVVTSDSGNDGAYGVIDPETGATVEQGRWPLGDGNDDVEGLAVRGGRLVGLTSAGYAKVWERQGASFALVDGPYAIGDGEMVCTPNKSNCKRNYEGLCLAAKPAGPCVGFALSKEDGALYCLGDQRGRLVVNPAIAIEIARGDVLADCAFDDRDRLWVGSNLFDLNNVYRIDHWDDPAHATVTAIGSIGIGFSEVIAVRGDDLYRMSDTGGSPSGLGKFRCGPVER